MKQIKSNHILLLFLILLSVIWDNNEGSEGEIFKCPPSLRDNVEFWKDIFTKYDREQVVLHDKEYINIIYEVIDLKKEFSGNKYSTKQKLNTIKRYKKIYIDILSRLQKFSGSADKLSGEEYRVFNLFERINKKDKFYRAKRNIRSQYGLRDKFINGLIIQGKYIRKIKEILREEGIPEEISALPHVESSYNTNARSKRGAVGIWQFTRPTGKIFLRINSSVDERKDPFKSTTAVAKLFKNSYELLQSWPLAVLAHNYGAQGVRRAVRKLKTRDISVIIEKHKTNRFGFASKNFYPEFLAAVEVEKNYKDYFGEIELSDNLELESLVLNYNNSAGSLLKLFNIERKKFIELNPHINKNIITRNRIVPKRTLVYLPPEKYFVYKKSEKEDIKTNKVTADSKIVKKGIVKPKEVKKETIKSKEEINVTSAIKLNELDLSVYTEKNIENYFNINVSPDETLWHYARWSGISINSIKKANNIKTSNHLRLHQKIKIPLAKNYSDIFENKRKEYHKKIEENFFKVYKIEALIEHQIEKGENIWEICYQIYGVPFWLVYRYNDINKLVKVKPGDNIIIPILKKGV